MNTQCSDTVKKEGGNNEKPRPPWRKAELRAEKPGEISAKQRDREMAEINEAQQSPTHAETKGKQPVKPAG